MQLLFYRPFSHSLIALLVHGHGEGNLFNLSKSREVKFPETLKPGGRGGAFFPGFVILLLLFWGKMEIWGQNEIYAVS